MKNEFERENRYIVLKRKHLANLPSSLQHRLKPALDEAAQLMPKFECVVIESDWPEYEPTWKMIEVRMTGAPVSPQADAQQAPAPSGITWRADGDANVYTLMRDGNWLASMCLNGELSLFNQEVLLSQFVGAEPSKALKEWKQWGDEASAEIDRLQGIEAERDTLSAQLVDAQCVASDARRMLANHVGSVRDRFGDSDEWKAGKALLARLDAISTTAKPGVQS